MSTHLFVAEWHRLPRVPREVDVPVTDTKRVLVVILGTVAILAGSHIAYKYIKRHRLRARENEIERQVDSYFQRPACDRKINEARMCIVCTENRKEVILLPCGHVCLCQDCSDHIAEYCPVCRQRIESRPPAFIT